MPKNGSDMTFENLINTYLRNCVLLSTDCQYPFHSASRVVTDCALCTRESADLRHVLATLTNTSCSFSAGNDCSNVNPVSLVLGWHIGRWVRSRPFIVGGGRLYW